MHLPPPQPAGPSGKLPARASLEELPESLRLEILRTHVTNTIAAHEFFDSPAYAKYLPTITKALLSVNSSEDLLLRLAYDPDVLKDQVDSAAINILDCEED